MTGPVVPGVEAAASRPARWEVVTTDDAEEPFHARLMGANGEQIFRTGDSYPDRRDAVAAVRLARTAEPGFYFVDQRTPAPTGVRVCPECAAAKNVNCTGEAYDAIADELVPCDCPPEHR